MADAMPRTLRVALTQTQPTLNVAENLARALALVEESAAQGAELIVIPENALCIGTNARMREAAVRHDGPELQALGDAARQAGAVVVLGGAKVIGEDGRIRNSAIVFDAQGRQAACYDKVHLFNAVVAGAVFNASSVEQAGDDMLIVDVKGVKVGVTICYDIRFPDLFRKLALAGAEVILIPAAFTQTTGAAHWEVLVRARAIESSAFVVASATIRGAHSAAEGFETYGHALAVDPWGKVLADLGVAVQAVQVLDLPMADVERVRANLPVLAGVRPDVYAKAPVEVRVAG